RLKKRDKMHTNHKMHLYYYISRMSQFDCYTPENKCDLNNQTKLDEWCPSCLAKHLMNATGVKEQG
ncbi:MAG: hypothetical protein ACTSPB_04150, partial [Candidatus Thorarchaeota archaeon]